VSLARFGSWLGAVATLSLYGLLVPLALGAGSAESPGAEHAVWPIPFVAMALVGAFLAARRHRNTIGWLFLGAGLLMVSNAVAQASVARANLIGGELPATHVVAWLALWTWMPATILIALVLVLFPTGRSLTPFWGWVARVELAAIAVVCAAALPPLGAPTATLLQPSSPSAVPGGEILGTLAMGPLPALLPVGFVALAVRFARARGIERLQMKWFVFGAAMLALSTLTMLVIGGEDPITHPLVAGSLGVGMTAIPVASAVAILRHRLYDIDRIINKTLVYGVLTLLLGAVYVGIVVGLGTLVGQSTLLVAASTLLVAALFRPARRRVQGLIDRRFYRSKYDAARTLESFSARLREDVDLDSLTGDLVAVVRGTMQPAHASLWLRSSEGHR
jgi:hypothetical protein